MHSVSSPGMPCEDESGPTIAIVCSGNWWVASDQIGPMLLKRMEGRYDAAVEIHEIGTAAFALLDCLKSQDLMLIVDACVLGGAPGEIHVIHPDLDASSGFPSNPYQSNLHQIGPMETLMVAGHLYPQILPTSIRLILVETEGLEAAQMNAACERAVSIIDKAVEAAKDRFGRITGCGRSR